MKAKGKQSTKFEKVWKLDRKVFTETRGGKKRMGSTKHCKTRVTDQATETGANDTMRLTGEKSKVKTN